ncbi:hypothetical protein [Bosea caraganae]|uniref:hypothetical protein n=1 Tax=Bosea caraganae TaxID=2763117 RepID=UPI0011C0474F|nr:hypothetical protein [Bosea caraganae]
METQHAFSQLMPPMTDPEWIALESLEEETRHFIFGDTVLLTLKELGFVEPEGGQWRVTEHGHRALSERTFS